VPRRCKLDPLTQSLPLLCAWEPESGGFQAAPPSW